MNEVYCYSEEFGSGVVVLADDRGSIVDLDPTEARLLGEALIERADYAMGVSAD